MSHTGPDWGINAPKLAVYNLSDMAELAARLKGCVNTYDRRGNVVWWDDFEDNINKWEVQNYAGSTVALSSDTARNGAKSGKLTTDAVLAAKAGIAIYRPAIPRGGIGAEISFNFYTQPNRLDLELSWYTGTRVYIGRVRIYDLSGNVDILKSSGAQETVITQGLISSNLGAFYTVKLVIDAVNYKYKRLLFGSYEVDLSDYPLYNTSSPNTAQIRCEVLNVAGADLASSTYVDDFILTQNEP